MFDISFSELLIIAVVALLVIGPEKLPKVARTVGAFTGRLQRFMAQVKDEVNREARFEELQKLQQEVKDGASKFESNIRAEVSGVKSVTEDIVSQVTEAPTKKTKRKTVKPNLDPAKPAISKKSNTSKSRANASNRVKALKQ